MQVTTNDHYEKFGNHPHRLSYKQ